MTPAVIVDFNVYVCFSDKMCRQDIGIPMAVNFAPHIAYSTNEL